MCSFVDVDFAHLLVGIGNISSLIWFIKFSYYFYVFLINWFDLYWNKLNSVFSLFSVARTESIKIYVKWLPFTTITICACVWMCISCSWLHTITKNRTIIFFFWQFSLLFNFTVIVTSRSLRCDFGRVTHCVHRNMSMVYVFACWLLVYIIYNIHIAHCATLNWCLNVSIAVVNHLACDLINIPYIDIRFSIIYSKAHPPNYV